MLLARYFIDRTTPDDTDKAINYLCEALDIDPDFALGWAQLARAFALQAGKGWVAIGEGYGRSRAAVDKALAIEPELAVAHALLGRIRAAYEMDLSAARVIRKSARDRPGQLCRLGRFERPGTEIRQLH